MSNQDNSNRRSKLSPAKQALLNKRLLRDTSSFSQRQAIPRRQPGESAQLSFAQQRLWFLDQLEPNSFFYNCPMAIRLRGQLNLAALQFAINEMVERHEVLRTSFPEQGGLPVQKICGRERMSLPLVDLMELAEQAREIEARRIAICEAQQSFDLGRGPLLRVRVIRMNDGDYILLFTMHHIVSDDWSMRILMSEVSEFYGAFIERREPALKALPIQYADYAAWQAKWLRGEVLDNQLSYWVRHLEGAPVLDLPTDRSRPPVQAFRGAHQSCSLPSDLFGRLKAMGLQVDATSFMVLLSGYIVVLYCFSGQEDVVIGTPITGRTRIETESLIGFFVNTLVLRADLSGDPSFKELVARVREITINAYAHQDAPFEKVVEALQPVRDLSRNPIFQVWFFFQNAARSEASLPGIAASPLDSNSGLSRFDLSLGLYEVTEGIAGGFEYNSDLFEAKTMARLALQFETVLKHVADRPDIRLGQLKALLDEANRRSLLIKATEQKKTIHDKLKSMQRKPTIISATSDTNNEERVMKFPESFKPGIKGPEQARRVPVRVSKENLVRIAPLDPDRNIPTVVEPVAAKMDLVAWAAESQDMIDSLLLEHRALLFHGFRPMTVTEFGQVVNICSKGNLLEYKDRSSPRHTVGDKIYTSTDYPADQTIFLHNEGTYWNSWPLKIFFYCATTALRGGETPIADCRRIAARLDQEIKNRFIEKQILYVRNYNDGFGLKWQDVFQTSDRAAVEDHCRRNNIEFEWKPGNRLRTRAVRPAISIHPRTGETMWFNHATFFHVTTLEPEIREAMLAEFKEEDLPYNTYYGDGSQIEPHVLEQLREAYCQEKTSFAWQDGDLMLLDNMTVAHARAPYEGARKVLVGMADPHTRTEL